MPANVSAVAISPLLALIAAVLVIAALLRTRVGALIVDHPNHRSLHAVPTPRIGGIGVVCGVLAGAATAGFVIDPRLTVATALLVSISLVDDIRCIGAGWRMAAHLTAAALAATTFFDTAHNLLPMLATVLAVAWMTNLYNFMDGSDGLAGGMAVFGFGGYGIAALLANAPAFAALNLAIAAAAAGFLVFNFPPARIFLGDAGAIPLGFFAAVCGLAGWQQGVWPLWFGPVVFSPFVVDASLTLARRLARGARVWEAHREHYYQRLVQAGWGHRKTLLAEFALMAVMCLIALAGLCLGSAAQHVVWALVVALYLVLIGLLEIRLPARVAHG
jgi:UDP-N-acetylmuramyl pentapeptide phosphotransferase/UDP-N-acetylglucosamine-1-phosphate transferase